MAESVNARIPIVYVGEKETEQANVRGIRFNFVKDIPQLVELRFAKLLLNRGNYVEGSAHQARKFENPQYFVKKVLIARTLHSLGDMLYATLAPKAMKKRFPQAQVDIAVPRESFPVWQWHPYIDNIMASNEMGFSGNPAKGKLVDYDVHFDITRPCVRYEMAYYPSRKSRIDIYMEHCGVQMDDSEKQPIYTILPAEREAAKQKTGGRYFIGIQLRANSPDRNWNPGNELKQEKNNALIKRILGQVKNLDVMVIDQHSQFMAKIPDDPRIYKAAGNGIRESMALMERCVAMVTLNSGLLVAAGALGIPQVTMFGNLNPDSRIQYLPDVTAVCHPEACPYNRAPCWGACNHSYCMDAITVDEVFGNLVEKVKGPGQRRLELLRDQDGVKTDEKDRPQVI